MERFYPGLVNHGCNFLNGCIGSISGKVIQNTKCGDLAFATICFQLGLLVV
jgi:hypothetical protein